MKRNTDLNARPKTSIIVFFWIYQIQAHRACVCLSSKRRWESLPLRPSLPATGQRAPVWLPVTQKNPSCTAFPPRWVSWLPGFLLTCRLFPVCIPCASPRPASSYTTGPDWPAAILDESLLSVGPHPWSRTQGSRHGEIDGVPKLSLQAYLPNFLTISSFTYDAGSHIPPTLTTPDINTTLFMHTAFF